MAAMNQNTEFELRCRPELLHSACGFGVFAGDEVLLKTKTSKWKGHIVWVDRSTRTISVHNSDSRGYWVGSVDELQQLKRTGERQKSLLFDCDMLGAIVGKLNHVEKVFFLYHYYGAGKKAAQKVCNRLDITEDRLRTILQSARKRKWI